MPAFPASNLPELLTAWRIVAKLIITVAKALRQLALTHMGDHVPAPKSNPVIKSKMCACLAISAFPTLIKSSTQMSDLS